MTLSLANRSLRNPKSALLLSGLLLISLVSAITFAQDRPVEIHDRIAPTATTAGGTFAGDNRVALTLDACAGRFDEDLINFLIDKRIPATIFATKKWLDQNPRGLAILKRNLDLFEIEDHGEKHIPAVIGAGRKVYGIPGQPDIVHLRREVQEGARAIEVATGIAPHWYRGATAEYDLQASDEIARMHYKIAGFSVNADAGATLPRSAIVGRLRQVKGGDVIIAHMNKPAGDTAEALALGLTELHQRGLIFVRLDQVELRELTDAKAAPK